MIIVPQSEHIYNQNDSKTSAHLVIAVLYGCEIRFNFSSKTKMDEGLNSLIPLVTAADSEKSVFYLYSREGESKDLSHIILLNRLKAY